MDSNRVEQIIFHEKSADAAQAEADAHRWEAARLISEELDAGKTERQLGQEIGKSHTHVHNMARVWRKFGNHGCQERPFPGAYAEAKQPAERDPQWERMVADGRKAAEGLRRAAEIADKILIEIALGHYTIEQLAAEVGQSCEEVMEELAERHADGQGLSPRVREIVRLETSADLRHHRVNELRSDYEKTDKEAEI